MFESVLFRSKIYIIEDIRTKLSRCISESFLWSHMGYNKSYIFNHIGLLMRYGINFSFLYHNINAVAHASVGMCAQCDVSRN